MLAPTPLLWLPHRLQQDILTRGQQILEAGCWDFGQRHLRPTMSSHGRDWTCVHDGELNEWTKIIIDNLPKLSNGALRLEVTTESLEELIVSVNDIGHWAAHRIRGPAGPLASLLSKGCTFLRMLRDDGRAKWLGELAEELEGCVRQGEASPRLETLAAHPSDPRNVTTIGDSRAPSYEPGGRNDEPDDRNDEPDDRNDEQDVKPQPTPPRDVASLFTNEHRVLHRPNNQQYMLSISCSDEGVVLMLEDAVADDPWLVAATLSNDRERRIVQRASTPDDLSHDPQRAFHLESVLLGVIRTLRLPLTEKEALLGPRDQALRGHLW